MPDHFLCIEAMKRKARRISYSELTRYGKCYRAWWIAYMLGIEKIKPNIRMLVGKIFGECLDQVLSLKPTVDYQTILTNYRMEYQDDDGEVPRELLAIEGFMQAISEMEWIEEKGKTQFEFKWKDSECLESPQIHGFLDWIRLDAEGRPSYGREFKYTTNMDGWSKFIVGPQLGTYFIGVPVDRIELVLFKVPSLKWIRKGKNSENGEAYRNRVYNDVKFNKLEYIYRQNFYRNEFSLEDVKERYAVMTKEMYDRVEKGESAFWQTDNRSVCLRECDYLEICSNDGVISEQLYKKKEVKSEKPDVGQG